VGLDLHRTDHRPVRRRDLVHARLRQGLIMNFETIVGLILAVLALGYLLYALLRPEEL
jgi:K+-transporting ATPase KdpF subunit